MKPNQMRVGIDFGETIESKNSRGEKIENPQAMAVISKLVKECEEVFIISKVNPQQMVEVATWMRDHNFFEKTGFKMENLRFCPGRKDKGPIAKELNLTHHIDDRPEVFASMSKGIHHIMFDPIPEDVKKWNQGNTKIVTAWNQIERILLSDD